eukprot:s4231_g3.t1
MESDLRLKNVEHDVMKRVEAIKNAETEVIAKLRLESSLNSSTRIRMEHYENLFENEPALTGELRAELQDKESQLRKAIQDDPSANGLGPDHAIMEHLESAVEVAQIRAQDLVSEVGIPSVDVTSRGGRIEALENEVQAANHEMNVLRAWSRQLDEAFNEEVNAAARNAPASSQQQVGDYLRDDAYRRAAESRNLGSNVPAGDGPPGDGPPGDDPPGDGPPGLPSIRSSQRDTTADDLIGGRPWDYTHNIILLLMDIEKMMEFLVQAGYTAEHLHFLVPMNKMRGTNEERAEMREVVSNFFARVLKGTFPMKKHYEGFEDVMYISPIVVYLAHREKQRNDELLITAQQSGGTLPDAYKRKIDYTMAFAAAEASRGKLERITNLTPNMDAAAAQEAIEGVGDTEGARLGAAASKAQTAGNIPKAYAPKAPPPAAGASASSSSTPVVHVSSSVAATPKPEAKPMPTTSPTTVPSPKSKPASKAMPSTPKPAAPKPKPARPLPGDKPPPEWKKKRAD